MNEEAGRWGGSRDSVSMLLKHAISIDLTGRVTT